jgi:hypothetical protein
MNRALYYSLMESRHLMRDTILMEDWAKGDRPGSLRMTLLKDDPDKIKPAQQLWTEINGVKVPVNRPKASVAERLKAGMAAKGKSAGEALRRREKLSKWAHKKVQGLQDDRAREKAFLKANLPNKSVNTAKLTGKDPAELAKAGANRELVDRMRKTPGMLDIEHPHHIAQKAKQAVGQAGKSLGAEYEHYRRGGLKAGLSSGVKVVAPLLAGMAIGARRIGKEVQKMPAYQHAKDYGDAIEKIKKYGPYAAAAGVGYLGMKALSND